MKLFILSLMLVTVLVSCTSTQNTKENKQDSELLAGTSSKYMTFSKTAYDTAIAENKIIILYFYAQWCPSCKAEQETIIDTFNGLDKDNIVAFRVNYRDSDVDKYEEALAIEHGITYQHTKVIIKEGQRILKAPDTWDKDRYIDEINKVS